MLSYEGDDFITCAYLTLLGRLPEAEGFAFYKRQLDAGMSKLRIACQLYLSGEARQFKAHVAGLDRAVSREKRRSLPLIGLLFRLLDRNDPTLPLLSEIYKIQRQIRQVEKRLNEKIDAYADRVSTIQAPTSLDGAVLALFSSFDPNYYLRANEDVARAGMNPYEHWVLTGLREGRRYFMPIVEKTADREEVIVTSVADGVWEWADYNSVKDRIATAKSDRRSCFTPNPVRMIDIDDSNLIAIAKGLGFPQYGVNPQVSIIIPIYNNLKITLECLLSIKKHTKGSVSYEIILADDASSNETSAILTEIANVKYIRNKKNTGFLRNANQALGFATGEYVVFLNNDTQVTAGWLSSLLDTFTKFEHVGAVGPRFIYPSGYLQEVGGALRLDGSADMLGLNEDPNQPRFLYERRVDYVSGACLLLKTELAKSLGGFSEEFLPCYCEDSDLCLRIRRAGYDVYVNPNSTIFHHLSKTTASLDEEFKLRSVTKNLAVLRNKWYDFLERQRPRIIAMYLPQFYQFPQNDSWWGTGFTEWTNVTKAQPNFIGHYQPRLPSDLGFYDLRVPDVLIKQAALAARYGLGGFCFYYYWFAGQRLLDMPVERLLNSKQPDFPFCLCWANENWTRRWDGQDHEVLMAQAHSETDDENVIRDLIRFFRDHRYIRVDGRPLLLVYRVLLFPDFAATAKRWRRICRDEGVGEIYIVMVESFELVHKGAKPDVYGCDAAVEFPPQGLAEPKSPSGDIINPEFVGHVADYRDLAVRYATREMPDYKRFLGVMPGWDNTPRRQDNSFCFEHASPGAFQAWLEEAIDQTRRQYAGDERLVFVNAWNEWAEGAYLEPDRMFGHSYLQAVANALDATALLR